MTDLCKKALETIKHQGKELLQKPLGASENIRYYYHGADFAELNQEKFGKLARYVIYGLPFVAWIQLSSASRVKSDSTSRRTLFMEAVQGWNEESASF